MRPYVSIDIETTGLNPETCQVIQIGAVIDDYKTPIHQLEKFNCYIDHDVFRGEAYALSMHAKIFRIIAETRIKHQYVTLEDGSWVSVAKTAAHVFNMWLEKNGIHTRLGKIIVGGKNFGAFDKGFLEKLPEWKETIRMKHRFIDPGSMYYVPGVDDGPPSTEECLKRAGLVPHVNHTAPEDAFDVVRLVRHKMPTKDYWDMRADGRHCDG